MDPRAAAEEGASRRAAVRRIALYAAVVVALLGFLVLSGRLPTPDEARDWAEGLGDWAYVAFVPLFVVANFLITWPILAGAGGLLFGTAVATPLAIVAVTLASLAQMLVARRLAAGHHGALLPARTRAVEDFLTRHGAVAVLESRIVPGLPWGLVNYSAGLTRLRYRDLALGTAVGGAPKVFAYVALGGSLSELGSPEAIVALALLGLLALAGLVVVKRQITRDRA